MTSIEEEEQQLLDAEAEFKEEEQTEEQPEEETNMQILTALGFKRYDDDDGTNFSIRILNTKIGVKFNNKDPAGKVWAYVLTDDNKKDFVKNGNLKELPIVQRYLDIQAGKNPIPEPTVTGRIIEKRGKGILIEIEEDGEKKEIFFGQGAVKRHDDGHHYIPYGFSKPSQDNPDGKMCIPRDILLPDLDDDPQPENREEAEAQRIRDEQGRAPAATTIPTPAAKTAQPPAAAKPTVKENLTVPTDSEKVDYYINLIGKITEKVGVEERISSGERGYAISKVFDAITRDRRSELIAELNGGKTMKKEQRRRTNET